MLLVVRTTRAYILPQATLEIEFMQQSLGRFVSPGAGRTLAEVYTKISQAYVRRPGDEALTSLLESVKKTLSDTRRGTRYEFACFKSASSKEKKPGTRSGASTPTGARPTDQSGSLGIPPVPTLTPASSMGRDSESTSGSMAPRSQERPPRRRPAAVPATPSRSSDTRI